MQEQICKKCKKRPIYWEHSQNFCFRCYETRKNGNIKYRNLHKKENYERTKKWNSLHPEKAKEYRDKSKQNSSRNLISKISNKEWKQSAAGKASAKRYYENHKKQAAEYAKQYKKINKEKVASRIKRWASENSDKICGYVKKYRDAHPEQVNKSSRKRREVFKSVVGTFTLKEWNSLCEKFGNRCLWCGRTDRKLTVDHVIPVTKGGTGYIENIQPLCPNCNSKKNNRIIDFRPFGSAIMEWT